MINNINCIKSRDVSFFKVGKKYIFSSIDIASGIGDQRLDSHKANLSDVAYFVARTALVELLCLNVSLSSLAIASSLSHEHKDDIQEGIDFLSHSLNSKPAYIFSHENYTHSSITSLSVTASGFADPDQIICDRIQDNSLVYYLGSGFTDVPLNRTMLNIPNLNILHSIVLLDRVLQVIPVGSRGGGHDILSISQDYGLIYKGSSKPFGNRGGPGLQFLVITDSELDIPDLHLAGRFVSSAS